MLSKTIYPALHRVSLILSVILLFLLNATVLFAQNQTADWYIEKPILGVRFLGLKNVSEVDMRSIAQPYLEKDFTLELFWELQGKLYATDVFESLESNAVTGDEDYNSVIIEFVVKERPIVKDVLVTGNQGLRTSDITAVMMLSRGDVFDPIVLGADEAAILAFYEGEGYPDAAVDVAVTGNDEDGEVALQVNINEGFSVVVEKILFFGNQFASESTLRGRIRTKQRSLFGSGAFRESVLELDKMIVEAYYSSNGYVDAEVERVERDETLVEDEGKRLLTISFYLSEGQQYSYGGMSFEGNQIFLDEELQKLVRHPNGQVVNRDMVEADYIRIQDLYFENGYIYNKIELIEERSEQTRTIVFFVKIIEKDRAHIENIILEGNDKTVDTVLLRELPFEVGDVFNKTQILQGLRNLYNTQYFSSVTPETPPGSAEGLIDVVISVEEQSTADVNFGVTIGGSDFPFAGQVRWNERNFLGTGQTLGASIEISPLKQSLTFEFVEPWFLDQRWSGGISLGVDRSVIRNVPQDILPPIFNSVNGAVPDPYENEEGYDPDSSIEDQYTMEYNQWDIGLGVTTSYRMTAPIGFVRFSGGLATSLSYLTYDTAVYRPFDSTIRDEREQWVMVNRLDTGVAWDSRDFFLNPTEGFLFSQHAAFTGGVLLGRRHFIRLRTRAEVFATLLKVPMFTNWDLRVVLAAHSGFVLVLPQFWVPVSERSKLDGDNLLLNYETDLLMLDGVRNARGWNLVSGGRARWENTLEFRVPIDDRLLWAVAFLDGAVLWPKIEDISLTGVEDFRFSLGAGFRFSIPQFPVRLYFANTFRIDRNFTKAERELPENALKLFDINEWQFVISLGGDVF